MALGIATRLSVREGRKFGFTVGLAFLGLGSLGWWRGRLATAAVFCGAGGLLLLASLIVPAHLRPVERAWMRLAWLISRVTTPIVIGAVYFGVITPAGILMRALGRNPLTSGRDRDTLWVARGEPRRSDLRRQF